MVKGAQAAVSVTEAPLVAAAATAPILTDDAGSWLLVVDGSTVEDVGFGLNLDVSGWLRDGHHGAEGRVIGRLLRQGRGSGAGMWRMVD